MEDDVLGEGSGGRRSLARKAEAAKKEHDRSVGEKARTVPGDYEAFHQATDKTRQKERTALQRQRQQISQRPTGGHERLAARAATKEAYKKAGFPGVGGLSSAEPEERKGSPTGGQGWPSNRAALKVQRGIKRLKQQDDVHVDPSRYMSEEGGPYRTGGAPERGSLSPGRISPGGHDAPFDVSNFEKHDLLPKEVMSKLKKEIGDAAYGYTREDLFRLARERGLLGTEESVSRSADKILGIGEDDPRAESWPKLDSELARLLKTSNNSKSLAGASLGEAAEICLEHDYKRVAEHYGGKYLGYAQPYQGLYDFPSHDAAQKFANHFAARTKSTPHVDGKRVSIDEPRIYEAGHLGSGGNAGPAQQPSPHSSMGSTKTPPTKEELEADEKKNTPKVAKESDNLDEFAGALVRGAGMALKNPAVRKTLVTGAKKLAQSPAARKVAATAATTMGAKAAGRFMKPKPNPAQPAQSAQPAQQQVVAHVERSESEKILGIEAGDPRGESWPKMSDEMSRLLNLEDNRYLAPKPGARVEFEDEPIEEATLGGMGVGAFLGGGLGGGLGPRLMQRMPHIPPYDASVDLEGEKSEKMKRIRELLKQVGLKGDQTS